MTEEMALELAPDPKLSGSTIQLIGHLSFASQIAKVDSSIASPRYAKSLLGTIEDAVKHDHQRDHQDRDNGGAVLPRHAPTTTMEASQRREVNPTPTREVVLAASSPLLLTGQCSAGQHHRCPCQHSFHKGYARLGDLRRARCLPPVVSHPVLQFLERALVNDILPQ